MIVVFWGSSTFRRDDFFIFIRDFFSPVKDINDIAYKERDVRWIGVIVVEVDIISFCDPLDYFIP